MAEALTELFGRKFGLAATGQLTSNGIDITQVAADATITVSAEDTNVRDITIQLKDANGDDITAVSHFWLVVFSSTAMTALSAGGSTGVEIGTDGLAGAVVAKRFFFCTSEADGDWDGTWTDTGTDAACIGVVLPTGRIVLSSAFANT